MVTGADRRAKRRDLPAVTLVPFVLTVHLVTIDAQHWTGRKAQVLPTHTEYPHAASAEMHVKIQLSQRRRGNARFASIGRGGVIDLYRPVACGIFRFVAVETCGGAGVQDGIGTRIGWSFGRR